jgi:hypothetical protein
LPARVGSFRSTGLSAAAASACLSLLCACEADDGGAQARAREMKVLAGETFSQAAEPGRCLHDDCARQQAGFAYAIRERVIDPDDCKGDEDFVEGCRQYGEDLDRAVDKALHLPNG